MGGGGNVYQIVFMVARITHLLYINILAVQSCDIEPMLENFNLSYITENHSSVTI